MKFIKEIIWSLKCGSYSGKGHKSTRRGNFEDALTYYQKALSFSDNEGGSVIIIECIARSYARLENYALALIEAEKCISKLENIDCSAPVFTNTKASVTALIDALGKNDSKKINELTNI